MGELLGLPVQQLVVGVPGIEEPDRVGGPSHPAVGFGVGQAGETTGDALGPADAAPLEAHGPRGGDRVPSGEVRRPVPVDELDDGGRPGRHPFGTIGQQHEAELLVRVGEHAPQRRVGAGPQFGAVHHHEVRAGHLRHVGQPLGPPPIVLGIRRGEDPHPEVRGTVRGGGPDEQRPRDCACGRTIADEPDDRPGGEGDDGGRVRDRRCVGHELGDHPVVVLVVGVDEHLGVCNGRAPRDVAGPDANLEEVRVARAPAPQVDAGSGDLVGDRRQVGVHLQATVTLDRAGGVERCNACGDPAGASMGGAAAEARPSPTLVPPGPGRHDRPQQGEEPPEEVVQHDDHDTAEQQRGDQRDDADRHGSGAGHRRGGQEHGRDRRRWQIGRWTVEGLCPPAGNRRAVDRSGARQGHLGCRRGVTSLDGGGAQVHPGAVEPGAVRRAEVLHVGVSALAGGARRRSRRPR